LARIAVRNEHLTVAPRTMRLMPANRGRERADRPAMRTFINLDHAFFAQPWRRYLTVALCLAWGLFEFVMGAVFWSALFIGAGVIALWQFRQIDWSKYDGGH